MKNILKGSIILFIFSISIILFNISCKKESIAQTNTSYILPKATSNSLGGVIVGSGLSVTDNGTISTQSAGLLIFAKGADKYNEFWTSKYDGTNQVKITISSIPSTGEIIKETIKLSPDGKKFFFQMNPNVTSNLTDALYSCNIDGSGLIKLIDDIDEFSDVK